MKNKALTGEKLVNLLTVGLLAFCAVTAAYSAFSDRESVVIYEGAPAAQNSASADPVPGQSGAPEQNAVSPYSAAPVVVNNEINIDIGYGSPPGVSVEQYSPEAPAEQSAPESYAEQTAPESYAEHSPPESAVTGQLAAAALPSAQTEPERGTLININTAGPDELMKLDGIGEVKAAAIIEYRETYGGFSSVEELTEVKGIGEKTLEKNRDRIMI